MTIELGALLALVGLVVRLTVTSATRADVKDLGERVAHVEGLLAPRPDVTGSGPAAGR